MHKTKLDKNGDPVTTLVDGSKEVVAVPSRLFHDLRRSGVRNMVVPPFAKVLPWRSATIGHAIFDRCNITSDEDIREAVKQTISHATTQPADWKVVSISKR